MFGYRKGYDDGMMFGYDLGYSVARDEYTVMYNSEINIVDDFNTFHIQLAEQYGTEYVTQIEMLFKKTVHLQQEYATYLIAHPNYAKSITFYQKGNNRIIHLVQFLIKKYLEIDTFESIGKAKAYCKLLFNLIDYNEFNFERSLNKFNEYRKIIMEKEWNRN